VSRPEVDFLLDAIEFVAQHGWKFMPLYEANADTGAWTFAPQRLNGIGAKQTAASCGDDEWNMHTQDVAMKVVAIGQTKLKSLVQMDARRLAREVDAAAAATTSPDDRAAATVSSSFSSSCLPASPSLSACSLFRLSLLAAADWVSYLESECVVVHLTAQQEALSGATAVAAVAAAAAFPSPEFSHLKWFVLPVEALGWLAHSMSGEVEQVWKTQSTKVPAEAASGACIRPLTYGLGQQNAVE
jgi:hypothetical protein